MKILILIGSAMLLSACSATSGDTPLVFVQSNTAGIDMGTSAATQGADFVLGYKGSDFAIVPVTFSQNDGRVGLIQAEAHKGSYDAFSVFGQFSMNSNAQAKSPKVGLGKFFATGLAAKRLADGFAFKLGKGQEMPLTPGIDCFGKAATNAKGGGTTAATTTTATTTTATMTATTTTSTTTGRLEAAAVTDEDAPTSAESAEQTTIDDSASSKTQSLVFGEYASLGLVVSGSATGTEAGFSLGFKDRDVAVIPAIARGPDGYGMVLDSRAENDFVDAFSVLGQFEADAGTKDAQVETSLGKFFVTGLAAKTLADGFAAKLCREYVAPK